MFSEPRSAIERLRASLVMSCTFTWLMTTRVEQATSARTSFSRGKLCHIARTLVVAPRRLQRDEIDRRETGELGDDEITGDDPHDRHEPAREPAPPELPPRGHAVDRGEHDADRGAAGRAVVDV